MSFIVTGIQQIYYIELTFSVPHFKGFKANRSANPQAKGGVDQRKTPPVRGYCRLAPTALDHRETGTMTRK
jgi:hypothetical protein